MSDGSSADGRKLRDCKKDGNDSVKVKVLGEDVEINPFVPKFMSETPWYMATVEDSSDGSVKKRSVRQVSAGDEAKSTDYDAKRDRWSKYDASEFDKVIDQHKEAESLATSHVGEADDIDDLSEATEKTGTGSLRIREDITPYLDVNADASLQYNPKSRAMVKIKNDAADDEFVAAGCADGEGQIFSWNKKAVVDGKGDGVLVEESFEAAVYDDDLIDRYAPVQSAAPVHHHDDDAGGEIVNSRKFVPSRTSDSLKK